jgi:hypothetical protein
LSSNVLAIEAAVGGEIFINLAVSLTVKLLVGNLKIKDRNF